MSTALLTLDEAAARLRLDSPSWLKRQVSARKVPHTRLGRRVFFTEEQVEQILAESAVQPGPRQSPAGPSGETPIAAPAPITLTARSQAARNRRTA